MKQSWKATLNSHGINLLTGDAPYYTVGMTFTLDREPERLIEQDFHDAEEAERFGYSMVEMAIKARRHSVVLAAGRFRDNGGRTDVHTEHCCLWHGCKYGEDATCPVVNEDKPQSHLCEGCDTEAEQIREKIEEILHLMNTRSQRRRDRAHHKS